MAVAYYPSCVARQYSRHQNVLDYTQFEGGLITQRFLSRFIATWPSRMYVPISNEADSSSSSLYHSWLQAYFEVEANSEFADLLTARYLLGPGI
ncbi:hypothetical protein JCGZ_15526 [Jatropha curcas]|uniref:Uncharacterized protein n=1 Tax=Jatropha curcas TaxID=180498 RepID=A0A067KES3_JATCU|nr:hypothetical protein JCGZ_15526 [Jatropha curcas]